MGKNLWDETLRVGVAEIDRQHQELFERFARLLEACRQGQGRVELKRLLDFLAEYAVAHFASEEGFMRLHQAPDFERHRAEHETFRRKLAELRELYADTGAGMELLAKTNATLLDWIIQHVRQTDRQLAELKR